MHVVVMGCGRVGAALATAMRADGHRVTVIDRDPQAFDRLPEDSGCATVVGHGYRREVLIEAGIERAGAFAAVTSGDNSNIIAARIADEVFAVPKVVARIYDAKRARVYERLGVPTVATVPWTTERLRHALLGDTAPEQWEDPTGSVTVLALTPHSAWVGRPLTELETGLGVRAAFLIRFGAGVLPAAQTRIQDEDTVYVAAPRANVAEVLALAAAPPTPKEP